MNRSLRHMKRTKPFYFNGLVFTAIIFFMAIFSIHLYLKNSIIIEEPKQDLGRKVIVELPNGKEIYTYENLIVNQNGELIYKGDRNTINLTGGKISYKEWN